MTVTRAGDDDDDDDDTVTVGMVDAGDDEAARRSIAPTVGATLGCPGVEQASEQSSTQQHTRGGRHGAGEAAGRRVAPGTTDHSAHRRECARVLIPSAISLCGAGGVAEHQPGWARSLPVPGQRVHLDPGVQRSRRQRDVVGPARRRR